ncbi:MAG: RNA polymerase sigma factor FliA [Sulfurospirillaceae bacterium]|jgi:RNA polymerase sigma factor for flagellar operon FliA|nr:RNA polymerase sigma factor FliA [Sulfurospirillaceae bacterium]MCK9545515.1 RNA polymerase sigma factor FliA [Sulfurospirillaceae bacterium]NLM99216.1 RNA polymerase sigma factor FliA [Campylobacteraceae bacterium]
MNPYAKKQLNAYNQNEKSLQDDLVLQYMPAVRAMAFRLKERLPPSVDVNDLISIGLEEMIKLSRRYDKEQNDSFWGFGKKRVYGSMLDYLRSLDVMSRANRRLFKTIEKEIEIYYNANGIEPNEEELAKILNEDIEKIRDARNASMIAITLPIDEQISLFEESSTEAIVEQDQLLEVISKIISTFKEREQLIIQLYYFEELNLKEISEILDISESRISQIHKKLLTKIREALNDG